MSDPLSYLPAIALHHHFKTSHVNILTRVLLRFPSSSPPARHPLCPSASGEAQEALQGRTIGDDWSPLLSLRCSPDEVPVIKHHCPWPQQELSGLKLHLSSFQNAERKRGQRGQESRFPICILTVANITLRFSSVNTTWPRIGCLGPQNIPELSEINASNFSVGQHQLCRSFAGPGGVCTALIAQHL